MLSLSREDGVLFMFILTDVDILYFFSNVEVDLEQDQKQTELLSGSYRRENHPIKINNTCSVVVFMMGDYGKLSKDVILVSFKG